MNKKIFSVTKFFIFFLWLSLMALAALLNKDFVFQNSILAVLTYSSFLLFLMLPSKQLAGKELLRKMLKLNLIVISVEIFWGFMQGLLSFLKKGSFDLSAGDAVDGTIHPALSSASDFSNVMFTANLIFSLIFILPFFQDLKTRQKALVILGGFVVIMASVMHLILFSAAALLACYIFFQPNYFKWNFKRIFAAVVVVGLPVLFVVNFMAANFSLISFYVKRIALGDNPKSQVVIRLFTEAAEEYPQLHITGLGPGQFSSRASLIGSGMYFGSPKAPKKLLFLDPSPTEPFKEHILDLWLWVTNLPYAAGSTRAPFSSWISFYSEFGGVTFVILLLTVLFLLIKVKVISSKKERGKMAFALGTGIVLLFLMGAQENYWEVPQAIMIGLLFIKVLYANVVYGNEAVTLEKTNTTNHDQAS
jgi:hypothetical protein